MAAVHKAADPTLKLSDKQKFNPPGGKEWRSRKSSGESTATTSAGGATAAQLHPGVKGQSPKKSFLGWTADIESVSFSPTNSFELAMTTGNNIEILDVKGQCKSIRTLAGHEDLVTSATYTPDGAFIISSSWDETVRIWKADTGSLVKVINAHNDAVTSVKCSPKGPFFCSSSWDKSVKIWNLNTGSLVKEHIGHHDWVTCIDYSPDGKYIASGSRDEMIWIRAVDSSFRKILIGHSGWVVSLAFSPNGTRLCSGSSDWTIKLWDTKNWTNVSTIDAHAGWVSCLLYAPDNSWLASGSDDSNIKIWKCECVHGEENISNVPVRCLKGHLERVKSLSYSKSAARIASGGSDKLINVWDLEFSNPTQTLQIDNKKSRILNMSPLQKTLKYTEPAEEKLGFKARYHIKTSTATSSCKTTTTTTTSCATSMPLARKFRFRTDTSKTLRNPEYYSHYRNLENNTACMYRNPDNTETETNSQSQGHSQSQGESENQNQKSRNLDEDQHRNPDVRNPDIQSQSLASGMKQTADKVHSYSYFELASEIDLLHALCQQRIDVSESPEVNKTEQACDVCKVACTIM